jgi:hypothetical protein
MIVPQRNICSEFFSNHNHIIFVYIYMFLTYHWKGLEESYNFVIGSTSVRPHMKKLWSHKVFDTFFPWGNMVAPQGTIALGSNLIHILWGTNVLETLCDHNFFHLSSNWNAFNNKFIAFLKSFPIIGCKPIWKKNEMINFVKKFVTYVSPRNLGLSPGKLTFPQGTITSQGRRSLSCLGEQFKFLENNHVFKEKELFFLWEHARSLGQFKPCSFGNMVVPWGAT